MSVERIADAMGLASHWTIYRWVQEGSIPARLIRPFELACGCEYVTRWLAASAHLLVVPLPSGRLPEAGDIQAVQEACTAAVSALLGYAAGRADADHTLAVLTIALEHLAAERAEVERCHAPELPLEGHDHD